MEQKTTLILLRMMGVISREELLKRISEDELTELEIKLYPKYQKLKIKSKIIKENETWKRNMQREITY